MSKLSDALREMGIYNTWALLESFAPKGKDVCCRYHPYEPRTSFGYGTYVWSPSHKTAPKAPWYDHGKKHFCGNRAESMPAAIAWASKRYRVKQWVTSPFGGKVPVEVVAAAKAAVKEREKKP